MKRPLQSYITLVLLYLLYDITSFCNGENELPTYHTPTFASTNVTHQTTNLCERYQDVQNGVIKIQDALKGLNISVGLTYYYMDPITGGIDENSPSGIIVQILDELAKRGGFEWRNTYGVVDEPANYEDKTWTDLLVWLTGVYDLGGDWWTTIMERMQEGVLFCEGFHDSSFVMIRKVQKEGDFDFFSFAQPFSPAVWGLIVITILITGICYYYIDMIDSSIYGIDMDRPSLLKSIYTSAFSFTGAHCLYTPKSFSTSLVTLSTGLVFLLMISAYTANLTNFLIKSRSIGIQIKDIDEAIKNNLRICVWENIATDEYLLTKYPTSKRVPKFDSAEVIKGVLDGSCDIGLTELDEWERNKRNADYNPDCNLDVVGRYVNTVSSGVALKDSLNQCRYLLRDVLNIHMRDIIQSGTLDKIRDDFFTKHQTVDCEEFDELQEGDKISLKNIGGIAAFHGMVLFVAMAYSCIALLQTPRRASITKDILKHTRQPSLCFKSARQLPIIDDGNSKDQNALDQPGLTIQQQQDRNPNHVESSPLPDNAGSIESNQQYDLDGYSFATSDIGITDPQKIDRLDAICERLEIVHSMQVRLCQDIDDIKIDHIVMKKMLQSSSMTDQPSQPVTRTETTIPITCEPQIPTNR